jgi:oligopeptide/dipeptide ABC transporter ATP-binding protein
MSKKEAIKKSVELLKKVGMPMPEERVNEYPHQLSGGMRQRAMISMAMSCDPALLIADEPTTALDVTIQAQILDLMRTLLQEFNGSLIMITHDLGVIAEIADKIAVMYASKIVEYSDKRTIFYNPLHPYTFGLMTSVPRLDVEMKRLNPIPGIVPNPLNFPSGCKFNPRCRFATERCKKEEPPLIEIEEGHLVRCWNIERVAKEVKVAGAEEVKMPDKEIVTGSVAGIDILDLEDAVEVLWKAGIYAESGMGCTGPIVRVSEARLESAIVALVKAKYLSE